MKTFRIIVCAVATSAATCLAADDFLDRVEDALTMSAFDEQVRARLSGLIDAEFYHLPQPAPGLIDSSRHDLFNPRLSLFLDTQLGPKLYLFVQSRVDRGFDPGDSSARIRLDEYALRFTPWDDGRLNLQIGKFATVVGNWVDRHLSWENPFITAPLPYENFTAISDSDPPSSARDFLRARNGPSYDRNPIVWGPSYTTGISIGGQLGKLDYAAEVKNASLASRPKTWDATDTGFDHPTFQGHIGYRPNQMWRFGVSASSGPYFRTEAQPALPSGRGIGDYREEVLGQDISFAWHHFQFWAECYEARFEVPRIGNADTLAYYLEAKYKWTPQFFTSLRWNQQLFASVPDGEGGRAQWGDDMWRIDAALAYRPTAHTQLKLQYSLEREGSQLANLFAAQFTIRF